MEKLDPCWPIVQLDMHQGVFYGALRVIEVIVIAASTTKSTADTQYDRIMIHLARGME